MILFNNCRGPEMLFFLLDKMRNVTQIALYQTGSTPNRITFTISAGRNRSDLLLCDLNGEILFLTLCVKIY